MREFELSIGKRSPRLSDEISDVGERSLLVVRKIPVQSLQTRFAAIKHLSCGLLRADLVDRRHTRRNLAVAGTG